MIKFLCFLGWLTAIVFAGLYSTNLEQVSAEKDPYTIIGRVENAYIDEVDLEMKARIDSGAGVTSINAEILEIIAGDPERVKFTVTSAEGKTKTLTRDVIDWMRIKKAGSVDFIKRPVVKMDICLGGKKIVGRVNLSDRNQFIYPVLIGRNLLKTGDFLIDPKKKFTSHHGCR